MGQHALILDEAPLLRLQLSQLLEDCGWSAEWAGEIDTGRLAGAGVIFIELVQSGGNGFQTLRRIRACCETPLILLTGTGRQSDLHWAQQAGAVAALQRPLELSQLRSALRRAGLQVDEGRA